MADPGEPFKQEKAEVIVGGLEKGSRSWAGPLLMWDTLPIVLPLAGVGGPGAGGQNPGLEQGKGGPATASGLGPSPIPVLRPQKPLHMSGGDSHRGKSLKLLEKIPEDAEATVVLVGKEGRALGAAAGAGAWVAPLWSTGLELCASPIPTWPHLPLPTHLQPFLPQSSALDNC